MSKSPDAFRTISEVAEWLDTPAHVLRFWESKFTQVKPVKRAGGRRYYRPADMLLLGGLKQLLHEDGLTIKGAQKVLREKGVRHVASLSQSLEDEAPMIEVDADDDAVELVEVPETIEDTVVPFKAAEPVTEPEPEAPATIEPEPAPAPEAVAAATSADEGHPDPEPEEPASTHEPDPEVADEAQPDFSGINEPVIHEPAAPAATEDTQPSFPAWDAPESPRTPAPAFGGFTSARRPPAEPEPELFEPDESEEEHGTASDADAAPVPAAAVTPDVPELDLGFTPRKGLLAVAAAITANPPKDRTGLADALARLSALGQRTPPAP